jgi:glycerophosphoryl diester phosphodiesterase
LICAHRGSCGVAGLPAAERYDRAIRLGVDYVELDVRRTADGTDNLLPVMRDALATLATVGEICNALRDVFGVHRPGGDI